MVLYFTPISYCTKLLFCAMLYISFYDTFDPYTSASSMLLLCTKVAFNKITVILELLLYL